MRIIVLTLFVFGLTNNVFVHKLESDKQKLKFQNYVYDLGVLYSDTIITKEFLYENVSQDTVRFIDIDKSCTCTNIFLNKIIIPPNEKGLVRLTVDTENKYGKFLVNGLLIADTPQKYYKLIIKGERKTDYDIP